MKLESRDFAKLRWHLLAAAIALIAAVVLVLWGISYDKSARQERNTAASRQNQIDSKLKQVRNEEQEIRSKASLFLQLQESGVLGAERRLDWSEMLTDLQRQMRLPAMEYEFAPQAALEGGPVGGYAFYKSTMKLRLHLIHEEDLLRLVSALETRANALVLVRACNLTRLPANAAERAGNLAQLKADCEIDWITARPQTAKSP